MSDLNKMQADLLAAVSKLIERHGFAAKPVNQSFYRSTPLGRHAFHLAFINHTHDFDITADVAIRFDQLEDLLQKNNKLLSPSERRNTASMGAELGNIQEGKQRRWNVADLADVPRVAAEIAAAFETIGLPYLDQFSTLEAALKAFSADDPKAWLHSPLHGERAKRAVGLAFLLGDKTTLDDLIRIKTDFLQQRKDFGLNSFTQFVKSLPPIPSVNDSSAE